MEERLCAVDAIQRVTANCQLMISTEELLQKPVSEIRQILEKRTHIPQGLLEALENDPRRGVKLIAACIKSRRLANRRETRRLLRLQQFEAGLRSEGIELIAGVDEAGVSPLAGPVYAAAVILPRKSRIAGLDDSKKIPTGMRREELAMQIKELAVSWYVARAEVEEIDTINIYHASLLAMRRAIEGLGVKPQFALVDARRIPECPCPQRGIIHGDALSASIAAASILAKTSRDAFMLELERVYPGYAFSEHKGYPTPEHQRLLKQLGACPAHRRSFAPVRLALGLDPVQQSLFEDPPDPSAL
jgi:ribonuclease HII